MTPNVASSESMLLFTKEVIDKGLIYVYIKGMSLEFNEYGVPGFVFEERIKQNDFDSYRLLPGETVPNFVTTTPFSVIVNKNFGVNKIQFSGRFSLSNEVFDGKKTNTYYDNLIKEAIKYRVVIINDTQKGRLAHINMNDYAEVKKAFNLKD